VCGGEKSGTVRNNVGEYARMDCSRQRKRQLRRAVT
jgi:hypothetical protein